jgi:hypothetical protein
MAKQKAQKETTEQTHATPTAEQQQTPAPERRPHPLAALQRRPASAPNRDGSNAPARARRNHALQRQAGNARLRRPTGGVVQTKLTVNQPGDSHEQEADRVAAQVMRSEQSGSALNQQTPRPLQSDVQRQETSSRVPEVSPETESYLSGARGNGRTLPAKTRRSAETQLGRDFSDVRVHDDRTANQTARSLNARAFTHGSDVYLGRGESADDVHLMAHELTHVAQQTASQTNFIARNNDPEPVDVFSEAQVRQALRTLARGALVSGVEQRSDAETFAQVLAERMQSRFQPTADRDVLDELTDLADTMADVKGSWGEHRLGFVQAATLLSDMMGLPPELTEVFGGTPSYGVEQFIQTVASDIAHYLIQAFSIYYSAQPFFLSLEQLQTNFDLLLERLQLPYALLELELEGSLAALVRLRAEFNEAETAARRAVLGMEIGRVSPLILLTSAELEPLRQQIEAGEERGAIRPTVLQQAISEQADQIMFMQQRAETEEAARTALGDEVSLLGEQEIEQPDVISAHYEVSILPEQAFPVATDEATLGLQRQLLERVDEQSDEMERLRSDAVPRESERAFTLEEFDRVYRHWFAFFSTRARDADPLYREIDGLIRNMYAIFGHVAEGGVARWILMEQLTPLIERMLGGPHTDFASQIQERALAPRTEELGGTAGRPEYAFAETFRGTRVEASERGEERSRDQHLRRTEQWTQEAFGELSSLRQRGHPVGHAAAELGLVSEREAEVPIYLLPNAQERRAWSYLITFEDPVSGREGREEKEMPAGVSRYLLAAAQQYATLAAPHTPGIGDRPAREQGIERSEAASSYRYLLGAPEGEQTESMEQAAAMRSRFRSAAREGVRGRSHEEHMQRVVSGLLSEMHEYFNTFFEERQAPEWRTAAILRISVYEYQADQALLEQFTPSALLKAIGVSLGIQVLVQALNRIPYVGPILSRGVGRLIARYGLGVDIASVISLAGWILGSGEAGTFSRARAWAYFGREALGTLGALVQGLAIGAGLHAFRSIPRRSSPPETVGEAVRDLEPILANDPEARQILRNQIRPEIDRLREEGAGTERSDDRLDLLETIDLYLRGNVSAPDRPLRPEQGAARSPAASRAEDIREQAFRDYGRLQTADVPYGGRFSREEFIQRYQEGLRFDIYTRRWYRQDGQPVTREAAERTVRPAEISRPEGYSNEQLQSDLQLLRGNQDVLFDRLDRLRRNPPAPGDEISQAHFNILKGNVAEMLSMPIQRRVLADVQRRYPRTELFSGVRARVLRSDGTLSDPVLFTDNIIASSARGNLYVRAIFEVKAGPHGGQEATQQIHRWIERHLDDGFVLELPDGRSFRYEPGSREPGQVVNLARAPRHLIAARGAEHLGETGSHGVAAPVRRRALPRSAEEINYLVRRVLEGT